MSKRESQIVRPRAPKQVQEAKKVVVARPETIRAYRDILGVVVNKANPNFFDYNPQKTLKDYANANPVISITQSVEALLGIRIPEGRNNNIRRNSEYAYLVELPNNVKVDILRQFSELEEDTRNTNQALELSKASQELFANENPVLFDYNPQKTLKDYAEANPVITRTEALEAFLGIRIPEGRINNVRRNPKLENIVDLPIETRRALVQVYAKTELQRENIIFSQNLGEVVKSLFAETDPILFNFNPQKSLKSYAEANPKITLFQAVEAFLGIKIPEGRNSNILRDPKFSNITNLPIETRREIAKFFGFLFDPKISESSKILLRSILSGKNMDTINMPPNIPDEENALLKEAVSFYRQLQIRIQFGKLLAANKKADELLTFLGSYKSESQEELDILRSLAGVAFAVRRKEYILRISESVTKGDLAKAIEILTEFVGKASADEDRNMADFLGKSLYKSELAKIKQEALKFLYTDYEKGFEFLKRIQVRPDFAGIKYFEAVQEIKDLYQKLYDIFKFEKINSIRDSYKTIPLINSLRAINSLSPNDSDFASLKIDLLSELQVFAQANKTQEYESIRVEVEQLIDIYRRQILTSGFENLELGDNKEATAVVREKWAEVLFPLAVAISGDRIGTETRTLVSQKDEDGGLVKSRLRYTEVGLAKTRADGKLTEQESKFIKSVSGMSRVNPWLVALAENSPGITDDYLRFYFDKRSEESWSGIEAENSYFPVVFIGTGPNGISTQTEILRNNPELSRQMLVVSGDRYPGGPFGRTQGLGFPLNSDNATGDREVLADSRFAELNSIRGYVGDSLKGLPGERNPNPNAGANRGSINKIGGAFVPPDAFSKKVTPDNQQLARMITLQSAVTIQNPLMSTKVLSIKHNEDQNRKGLYILKIERSFVDKDGKSVSEVKEVYTDSCVLATGLGDPTYGFEIEGSRAKKIMDDDKAQDRQFPKIQHTLQTLNVIANERRGTVELPSEICISGTGDSTLVVLARLAGLFIENKLRNKKLKKIYVIGNEQGLSRRPIYAAIKQLLPRGVNGEDLVEFVEESRVGDVDYASNFNLQNGGAKDRVIILDKNKRPILRTNGKNKGMPLTCDSYIACTGYKNKIEDLLKELGELENVELPTNKDLNIGKRVKGTNIFVSGVAANLTFPPETRDAFAKLQVVNGVSIGANSPAAAALGKYICEKFEFDLQPENRQRTQVLELGENGGPNTDDWDNYKHIINSEALLKSSENVSAEVDDYDIFMQTILSYELQKIRLDSNYSGVISLAISGENPEKELTISSQPSDLTAVSTAFIDKLNQILSDKYFVRYASKSLFQKRRQAKVKIDIEFTNGKPNLRKSVVQTG